ncbi:Cthe_2314 family HEPN domain-containing protein [Vibrio cholerae]|uniref:Cthe_2314 family HEPN domain-containing protein n=1 Tax=Vibrio cholerae TaxID=666 RepID=UPI00163C760A|nr:Cthe_2314 family HEPN domain-containing protein [Vibrio cholerae]
MLHAENGHIKQFFPLVSNVLEKGLIALQKGDKSYPATPIEAYALNVFSRVSEIDNAFKCIYLTLEYLGKKSYPDSEYDFSEHHAFHVENFLLRLTSVVDRCYLLVGSTLLMTDKKIEKLGGKKDVYKKIKDFSPESAEILTKMNSKISELKKVRNKVAHQAGFSNQNLGVIKVIENAESAAQVESLTGIMSLDALKEIVIDDSLEQFREVASVMDRLVSELIDSLAFVYSTLLERT